MKSKVVRAYLSEERRGRLRSIQKAFGKRSESGVIGMLIDMVYSLKEIK